MQITPLHWAAENGEAELIRLLLEKGADPTAKNKVQRTPLQWAARNGKADIVKILEDAAKDQGGHAGRVAKLRGSNEPQIGG